jgi:hypothetical protein
MIREEKQKRRDEKRREERRREEKRREEKRREEKRREEKRREEKRREEKREERRKEKRGERWGKYFPSLLPDHFEELRIASKFLLLFSRKRTTQKWEKTKVRNKLLLVLLNVPIMLQKNSLVERDHFTIRAGNFSSVSRNVTQLSKNLNKNKKREKVKKKEEENLALLLRLFSSHPLSSLLFASLSLLFSSLRFSSLRFASLHFTSFLFLFSSLLIPFSSLPFSSISLSLTLLKSFSSYRSIVLKHSKSGMPSPLPKKEKISSSIFTLF